MSIAPDSKFTRSDFFSVENGEKFNIAFANIEEIEDVFDKDNYQEIKTPKGTMISWGANNTLPYDISRIIGTDEVMSQNKLFNIQSLYGLGLKYYDKATNAETTDEKIQDFLMTNSMPQFFLEQATDMKYYFMSVMLIVLSNDRKSIAAIHHLEACNVRFEKADDKGHIKHIFYGDFKSGNSKKIVKYPLLDMRDPYTDLMGRSGRRPMPGVKKDSDNVTMYAIVNKFPTPGFAYYPAPYYLSVFKSGWFEIKQLAALYKKTKLKNFAAVKYLVTIHSSYWEDLIIQEHCEDDPEKQKQVIAEEKAEIKKFVTGIENTNKMWVTGAYTNADGKECPLVTITKVETDKEGGDYSEENQEACNMICYADGIHPNMVGAVPGKSQSNNSGSDKRELFTLKQSLETAFRDIMLSAHHLIIYFNGWNHKVKAVIPMSLLTTLDKHTDSETVIND